jgi:hypothetical protein
VKVTLTEPELALADRIGDARQRWNEGRSHNDAYGLRRAEGVHRLGARAELAVARALRLPWNPITEDPWKLPGDVARLEIRSTNHPAGRLILHPKDCELPLCHRPYVLVRHAAPEFDIVGWYRPSAGVLDEWWEVYRNGGGCWYVPSDKLASLPDRSVPV